MILKVVLTWLLFIPIAILNGIVRNDFYSKYTGELLAHQLSTVSASILFYILSYLMLRKEFINLDNKSLFIIGFSWVLATILFEFIFGHFIVGHPWTKLFMDYNIIKGRIWSLFLLITLFTPYLVKKLGG